MGSGRGDVGYASALSLIFFIIVLAITLAAAAPDARGTIMSENVNVATEVGVKTELEDTERAKIRAPRTKRGNLWSYIPLVLVALSFTLPLLS